MVGEKLYSVVNALGGGVCGVYVIAPVVFGCIAKVPAVNPVRCPGSPLMGLLGDEDTGAGWRKGVFVEVKIPI
jgi:hypothetical protein